jgi:hypothetical protein
MVIQNQSVPNFLVRLTVFQQFTAKTFKVKVTVFPCQPVLFTLEERPNLFSVKTFLLFNPLVLLTDRLVEGIFGHGEDTLQYPHKNVNDEERN